MNESERHELAELRALDSEQAATYLITNYGVENRYNLHMALLLMRHRTWKRRDQIRLARHFFLKRPFNDHVRLLPEFASFMSLQLLITLMRECMFVDGLDLVTFRKHVEPVLARNAKSKREIAEVRQLVAEVHRSRGGLPKTPHGGDQ